VAAVVLLVAEDDQGSLVEVALGLMTQSQEAGREAEMVVAASLEEAGGWEVVVGQKEVVEVVVAGGLWLAWVEDGEEEEGVVHV
jgi:hypothetical protein